MLNSTISLLVPKTVRKLAGQTTPTLVWKNELDGLTYRAGGRFIKWNPIDNGINLREEVKRLEWASKRWRVPELISHGNDEDGSWLVTKALDGKSAVDPVWLDHPLEAVRAIGIGLRRLHDSCSPEKCPFQWSLESRISHARTLHNPDILGSLGTPPLIDRLVVCHGDACSPNTILDSEGEFLAHVDLGCLGVADRWADLAVATMAATWNFGRGWEASLLEAYGIKQDPLRIEFYRRLWHLSS